MKAGRAGVDNQKMWQWSDGAVLCLRSARISSAVLASNSVRAGARKVSKNLDLTQFQRPDY